MARRYDEFARRWDILGEMSDRVVAALPKEPRVVLDLGAGTGMLSQKLLARYPDIELHLADPSANMLEIAREHLGDAVAGYHQCSAEALAISGKTFDTIVSSATLHTVDEREAMKPISAHLDKGGAFVSCMWGRSYAATGDGTAILHWRTQVDEALSLAGFSPQWPAPPGRDRVRTRDDYDTAGRMAGLRLRKADAIPDRISPALLIDFASMEPEWLGHIPEEHRASVTAKAMDLVGDTISMPTVLFVFKKF